MITVRKETSQEASESFGLNMEPDEILFSASDDQGPVCLFVVSLVDNADIANIRPVLLTTQTGGDIIMSDEEVEGALSGMVDALEILSPITIVLQTQGKSDVFLAAAEVLKFGEKDQITYCSRDI